MRRRRSQASSGLLLLGLLLAVGCGGPAQDTASPKPQESLTVYVPCLLSLPLQKAAAAFQETRPAVSISVLVDKPMAQLAELERGGKSAAVAVTFGEVEMSSLVSSGVVSQNDIVVFAENRHPLAVVAPAGEAQGGASGLSGLTSEGVKRIFLEDPAKSTLGQRAEEALKKLGLWEQVRSKVVRPRPEANLLAALLAGEADAAIVVKGCLFAEKGKGGSIPKTVRIMAEFPTDVVPPMRHQAAPLTASQNDRLARGFAAFLVSARGKQAIASAGLTPLEP